MSEEKKEASVPFYSHENTIVHLGMANRRMLIALICVCLTFIITICVFVSGYTKREQNWLDMVLKMQSQQEVKNVESSE